MRTLPLNAKAYATLTGAINYDLTIKNVVAGFERYYGRLSMQESVLQ